MPYLKIKKSLATLDSNKSKISVKEFEENLLEISTFFTSKIGKLKTQEFEEISKEYLSLKNWLDNQKTS